jgi:predicted nucleic acid-binding protein
MGRWGNSSEAFEIEQTTPELVERAVDVSILDRISFWNALIVAAAASSGCAELYSEDLNDGQVIQGVRVMNPFAASAR